MTWDLTANEEELLKDNLVKFLAEKRDRELTETLPFVYSEDVDAAIVTHNKVRDTG